MRSWLGGLLHFRRRRAPRAHIDLSDLSGRVDGWALDPNRPETRLEIEVRVDDQPAGRGRADRCREDLARVFGGDGCHAFSIDLDLQPLALKEGRVTLHDSRGRLLRHAEHFLEYDLALWRFARERIGDGDGVSDRDLRLWREGRLPALLGSLEARPELSEGEERLRMLLYWILGDAERGRRSYRRLLKRTKEEGSRRFLHRCAIEHCAPLWRRGASAPGVQQVHRLESFWSSWRLWCSENVKITEKGLGSLGALMLRHGFIPTEEVMTAMADLFADTGKDFEALLPLLRPAREIHRALLRGSRREILNLTESLGACESPGGIAPEQALYDLLCDGWGMLLGEKLVGPEEREKLLHCLHARAGGDLATRFVAPEETVPRLVSDTAPWEGWSLLREASTPCREDAPVCFLVQRNERERLPGFLDYYRALGVERFYIVDNGSDEEAFVSFLLRQEDVTLYRTTHSYAEARYGIDWVEWLLRRYRREGRWNLVLDADELLVLDEAYDSLGTLCRSMEERGETALMTILLDLYSRGPIREARYRPGREILESCRWYDAHFYTTFTPYGGPHGTSPLYSGGVRSRTFGIDSVVLNKYPLFRYDPSMRLREGMHWIEGFGKPRYAAGLLLHFKYLSSFHDYVRIEAARGEHWNGAAEYRKYHEMMRRDPDFSLYDPKLSVPFEGVRKFFESYPPFGEG